MPRHARRTDVERQAPLRIDVQIEQLAPNLAVAQCPFPIRVAGEVAGHFKDDLGADRLAEVAKLVFINREPRQARPIVGVLQLGRSEPAPLAGRHLHPGVALGQGGVAVVDAATHAARRPVRADPDMGCLFDAIGRRGKRRRALQADALVVGHVTEPVAVVARQEVPSGEA